MKHYCNRTLALCAMIGLLLCQNVQGQETPKPSLPAAPAAPAAAASGAATNDYALPEVGTLHLVVPKAWRGSFNKTIVMGTRADEIQFEPVAGGDFVVMVVAVHMSGTNAASFDTREVLDEEARKELPDAVEKKADIQELTGPQVKGHYLTLTDATMSGSEHKPGEYKYLTTGYAKLGNLVLILRLGSNVNGNEKTQALEMIRTARLTPSQ